MHCMPIQHQLKSQRDQAYTNVVQRKSGEQCHSFSGRIEIALGRR